MIEVPDMPLLASPPKGWIPEGASAHVLARRCGGEDEPWQAVIYEFSVAGMGETAEEAVQNAIELLEDYLALEYREGKSFEQALRPMGARNRIGLLTELLGEIVKQKLGRRPPRGRHERRTLALGHPHFGV